jgi:hypothetical protein
LDESARTSSQISGLLVAAVFIFYFCVDAKLTFFRKFYCCGISLHVLWRNFFSTDAKLTSMFCGGSNSLKITGLANNTVVLVAQHHELLHQQQGRGTRDTTYRAEGEDLK